jgi:type I restriction enzyme, S subunit
LQKAKPGYKLVKWLFGKEIEIPEEWEIILMKEADVKVIDGDRGNEYPNADEFLDSGYCLFLSTKNVTKNGFSFKKCSFISKEKDEKLRKGCLSREDIVITTRGTIGNIAYFERAIPYDIIRINSGMVILRNSEYVLSQKFLYQALQSSHTIKQFKRSMYGSAQPQLTVSIINSLKLIIPRLNEQQKIVSILSNVNELISSYDKTIQATKKLKTGLMQMLLTKGIGHKKFKKVPWLFGKEFEIPEEWEISKMSKICKKISVGIATSTTKYFVEDGIPLLRNQNIKNGYIDASNLLHISPEFAKMNESKKLHEGDVVCMRTGYPGQSAVITPEMKGWQTFTTLIIRPDLNLLDSYFLTLFLNSLGRKQITSTQAGAAQQNLNAGWLSNLLILLPNTLDEQQKIASILSSVDNEITKLELKKKSAEFLKKGLMQKLLTGQIRVKA